MAFRLTGEFDGRPFRLLIPEGESILGAASDCDLVLNLPTISRRHARIRRFDNGLEVEDLGSSNGTRIHERLLTSATRLENGEAVRFGDVVARVQHLEDADARIGLALPEHGQPHAEDDPSATMAPMAVDRFAFGELPRLLRAARSNDPDDGFVRRLGEAFWRSVPLSLLRLVDIRGADAVRFDAGAPTDQAPSVVETGAFRAELALDSARSTADVGPVLDLVAALLELVPDSQPAPSEPEPDAPPLPDPPPLDIDMQRIYARAARVANSDLNVLIQGESGTGKELLARYIHDASAADGPFVALNCAALSSDLLEAELFGIEKGVATGVEPRAGCFEHAHGGTLFLDEIGDMSADTQARILRVLQAGEVTRVGGSTAHPARPRVLSATHRDLRSMVSEGAFRLDLLHRISGWDVTLPPLRDRPADVVNLALHFLGHYCRERSIRVRGISQAALDALRMHSWPGNVRELQQEMHRVAVFLGDGDLLASDDLAPTIRASTGTAPEDGSLDARLASAERTILKRTLADADGNVTRAAERLGIGRSTLYRRLEALGLDRKPD